MKFVFLILVLSWVGIIISCGTRNHALNKEQDSANVKSVIKVLPTDSLKGRSVRKVEMKPNSIINVKSISWVLNEAMPDDSMVNECKRWSLSAGSIETIFKNGEPINMHDFSYLYYVLPCEVRGAVEIDSALYSYTVNAGSYFTISNEDTTYFYGCNSPVCKKFFLMEGGDPRRDIE
ncbi:hypothetical protein EGT74_18525 [Chitinophaga lutea]|uniref:Lipoprotein n=1 Tax=Chitinophaga lutea TaxID=2488634 RepID=A0A3N4PY55_9BACT|nr:hypothetical protein [Chitinophaga lutea]RPE09007.1 hypothetical protein EGT74_18525 [Chitinophaga lutea]